MFPSSFTIKASLKISDDSLPSNHLYFWACDMRNPGGSSFVEVIHCIASVVVVLAIAAVNIIDCCCPDCCLFGYGYSISEVLTSYLLVTPVGLIKMAGCVFFCFETLEIFI